MLKKINITNIIMIILALFLAIVLGITIYMTIPKKYYDPYTPKRYSREEVIELFENNTPLFNQVVQIVLANKPMLEEKTSYSAGYVFLTPDLNNRNEDLKLFSPEEQQTIKNLYYNLKIASITAYDNTIMFLFLDEDEAYYSTVEYYLDETIYNSWVSKNIDNPWGFKDLGNRWFYEYHRRLDK